MAIRDSRGGIGLLSAKEITALIAAGKPGRYAVGGDLYLSLKRKKKSDEVNASYVFLYQWQGKPVELGLGSARVGSIRFVSVKLANEKAQVYRDLLATGKDPRIKSAISSGKKTLGEVCAEFLPLNRSRWADSTYRNSWLPYLSLNDVPKYRDMPIADILDEEPIIEIIRHRTPGVRVVLKAMLVEVFDFAKARKYRLGLNPAAFKIRSFLDQPKITVTNHPSMKWREVPKFLSELRSEDPRSFASLCLEFQILTGVRPSEAAAAVWEEFNDLAARKWTIPARRMKKRKTHYVPLSDQALKIITDLKSLGYPSKFVFPSVDTKGRTQIAASTILKLIPKDGSYLDVHGVVPDRHGMRTSFCGWTEFNKLDDKIAQFCISHTYGDLSYRAYMREEAYEDRKVMLQAWADFCNSISTAPAKVKEPPTDRTAYIRAYMRKRRAVEYAAVGKVPGKNKLP